MFTLTQLNKTAYNLDGGLTNRNDIILALNDIKICNFIQRNFKIKYMKIKQLRNVLKYALNNNNLLYTLKEANDLPIL